MKFSPRSNAGWTACMAAGGVLMLGFAYRGSGFLNGDAAVYWDQAVRADLSERTVHLGYLALASVVAALAPESPELLDLLAALAGAVAVASVGWRASPWRALVAMALVVPLCAFAEVDLVWIALLLVAVRVRGPWGAVAIPLAVAVSPTAILAVPWVCLRRRSVRPALLTLVVMALLVGVSGGDWLWGPRGLLDAPPWRPQRVIWAWLYTLWWCAPLWIWARHQGRLARWNWALLPLILAPADVPTGVFVGLAVCLSAEERSAGEADRFSWVYAAFFALLSVSSLRAQAIQNRQTQSWLEHVANGLEDGERLVAPWTYGVRISLLKTGETYGLCWRNPDRVLAAQRCVCTSSVTREVHRLGPETAVIRGPAIAPELLPGCEGAGR